jgi:hypothetical protein
MSEKQSGLAGPILTCKDFEYTGIRCCDACHDIENLDPLLRIRVNGREALVCCEIVFFFYPDPADRGDFWQVQMEEAEEKEKAKAKKSEDFQTSE